MGLSEKQVVGLVAGAIGGTLAALVIIKLNMSLKPDATHKAIVQVVSLAVLVPGGAMLGANAVRSRGARIALGIFSAFVVVIILGCAGLAYLMRDFGKGWR